jgi:hypothetical protein
MSGAWGGLGWDLLVRMNSIMRNHRCRDLIVADLKRNGSLVF